MAQRNPEEQSTLNQVLKLVDQLSAEEREQLSQRLDGKSWGDRWRQLEEEIEENRIAKGLPPISEEEVYAEFTEHRRELKAKGAQGSN
ncbi:MAG TPA: hypothetical protein V6C81_20405 [Planktothrix sp.]|jgi:hypothetical protein